MLKLKAAGQQRRFAGFSTWEGLTFVLLVCGYFFIGIKLYEPVFERWKINSTLSSLKEDLDLLKKAPDEITSSLLRRFSVNGIYGLTNKNFKIRKTEKAVNITFNHDYTMSFPFDIDVKIRIDRVMDYEVPR